MAKQARVSFHILVNYNGVITRCNYSDSILVVAVYTAQGWFLAVAASTIYTGNI